MDLLLNTLTEWLKELLAGAIASNLTGMVDSVNTKVGDIAVQVGQTPQGWNSGIFSMIQNLSNNVILPIAGIILALVMTMEFIRIIMDKNNMHDFDTWSILMWVFKTACAILIVSNTWNIVMAVFDVSQTVVNNAAGIIVGNTDIELVTEGLEETLMAMELSSLIGLWFQSMIVGVTMHILSIIIMLICFGRMIEIYLVTSVAPIPMATMMNHEWSQMGQNYLRSLFALAFQGFLIIVCVAIYAVLVQNMVVESDISMAIWTVITFSHPRQKRNIRMRSLTEEYREDAIREVLAGRRIHNPRKRRSPLAVQKAQLVSALEAMQNQGRGCYYDLSIQNQITKQQARALLYYQQHGFTSADDFEAFAESVEAVKQRRDALSAQITSAEKRLNEIAVLQKHITNYLKTKDIYAGYRASGYSKAYYEEHEDAIKLCKASKRAFDELLPSDTSGKTAGSHKKQLPSLKALRAEYAELLAMKKAAYPEYYRAKDEYRELLTYQANLAGLFGIENVRSTPQREHQQEEK